MQIQQHQLHQYWLEMSLEQNMNYNNNNNYYTIATTIIIFEQTWLNST